MQQFSSALQYAFQFEINITIGNVFILLGVAFCFGLAFFLWHINTANQAARNCMALLTLSISLLALAHVLQSENIAWRQQIYTLISLQMVHGPLLYLYTRFQTEPAFYWRARYYLHFMPALVAACVWWWQLPLSFEHQLSFSCDAIDSCNLLSSNRTIHRYAAWLSLLSYAIWVLRILKPYERRIKATYSAIEDINLRWVKAIAWTIIALTLLVVIFGVLRLAGVNNNITGADAQAIAPFIVIILIARYGIRQVAIQLDVAVQQTPDENYPAIQPEQTPVTASQKNDAVLVDNTERKYKTSSLTATDAARLWERLQQLMHSKVPYQEPGLKISELAAMLNVPVHHLSETINGYANLSFYDYINQLRLDEAARLMTDPNSPLSVTDIGFQAGFNSTSTFFSQFKKRFQQTPRQMRSTLQNR